MSDPEIKKIQNCNITELLPTQYNHWTLKEIYEQPDSILRTLNLGGRILSNNQVKLKGFDENKEELLKINNIILLGCGSSYYASLYGQSFFKDLCNLNVILYFDGADFNENDIPKIGKTGLILLSQSGETKDLHRCIQLGKQHNLFLMGIINVIDSMIAREVTCGAYLNVGRENAVASTKSFTSQVVLLCIVAIWFSQIHEISLEKRKKYISDLRNLSLDIQKTIDITELNIRNIINNIKSNSCFILGKGNSEAIAKEGALKIKEISNIHVEGYSTSSLKHGPFALLEEGFPIIMLSSNNDFLSKIENAYQEILSRDSNIIFITNSIDNNKKNVLYLKINHLQIYYL